MSRLDLLVRLYRLALLPPEQEYPDHIAAWLVERQVLVDKLCQGAPGAAEIAVERALLALILAADRSTYDRIVLRRRELAVLLRRSRSPYG